MAPLHSGDASGGGVVTWSGAGAEKASLKSQSRLSGAFGESANVSHVTRTRGKSGSNSRLTTSMGRKGLTSKRQWICQLDQPAPDLLKVQESKKKSTVFF